MEVRYRSACRRGTDSYRADDTSISLFHWSYCWSSCPVRAMNRKGQCGITEMATGNRSLVLQVMEIIWMIRLVDKHQFARTSVSCKTWTDGFPKYWPVEFTTREVKGVRYDYLSHWLQDSSNWKENGYFELLLQWAKITYDWKASRSAVGTALSYMLKALKDASEKNSRLKAPDCWYSCKKFFSPIRFWGFETSPVDFKW